ncbi:MAG TPA: FHA domain-containing protein [Candidatus Acidoferrales bacterium]|nr:FHA domain-containing protein [Candidatus Acidoferrales bacterium]
MLFRPARVIKHCAEGHEMSMAWRTCPRCTGEPPEHVTTAGRSPRTRRAVVHALALIATHGPARGQRIECTAARLKLGKAPREEEGCEVRALADPYLSREHFAIERDADGWRVRDLASTNGTAVNGERVEDAALREGDELRAGTSVFQVRIEARDAPR